MGWLAKRGFHADVRAYLLLLGSVVELGCSSYCEVAQLLQRSLPPGR